jgi:hypothetical protein
VAMILVVQEAGGKGGKVCAVLRLAGWPVSTVRGTTERRSLCALRPAHWCYSVKRRAMYRGRGRRPKSALGGEADTTYMMLPISEISRSFVTQRKGHQHTGHGIEEPHEGQ